MSNNRTRIQFFGAGELIPAAEGFDAVSSGVVEMNYANAYFWTGKTFAAQYFTAVPFGLNSQGLSGWMYDGGGLELWREVYDRFNLMPFLCGNTGVQMTGWFRRPIERVEDLRGLKMRIPGLAGRVYQALGVDVRLLPPGELFPALERGVIDAAEFVGPFLDRQLGLQRVAKFYHTTGWHETATASELIINKAAWARLPNDLKAIVENAVAACNVISEAWCQKNNADAMEDLIRNQGVTALPLPDEVVARLGALVAVVVTALGGRLTRRLVWDAAAGAARITAMMMFVLICAQVFALAFRGLRGEQLVEDVFAFLPGGVAADIWFMLVLVFVLGFFLEWIEISYIAVPLFLPIFADAGVDPVWLATLIAVMLQTSFLTPPFGWALFFLRGAAPPEITTGEIYRGVLPFVLIQILAVALVFFAPGLATWLPTAIGW